MSVRQGHLRIGTSGWSYAHWIGPIYPTGTLRGDLLRCYAETFDTVEVNATFYRLPTAETVANWAAQTPSDFLFAVKASRYLTHLKRLKDAATASAKLFAALKPLGRKRGPMLLQLPPHWKANPARLEAALTALPAGRYVVEPRDPDWLCDPVYRVLERCGASLCLYDFAGCRPDPRVTSDFVYLRLHGPGRQPYRGSYPPEALDALAKQVDAWSGSGLDVFTYFDNDEAGYAAINARELKARLWQDGTKASRLRN